MSDWIDELEVEFLPGVPVKLHESAKAAIKAKLAEAEQAAKEQGFYMACGIAGIEIESVPALWEKCLLELQQRQV